MPSIFRSEAHALVTTPEIRADVERTVVAFRRAVRALCSVPLVASGGAGTPQHFVDAFLDADVDAALAASVFHSGTIAIPALKSVLHDNGIEVRCD